MIENAGFEDIRRGLEFTKQSEFAKATRRIVYNFSEINIEERGHFHVDVMSGIGSGLIVYQNFRFFLLTAKHNLKQLYPLELRNESPIWVPKDHPPNWDDMLDFFMARRIWYVGELIDYERSSFDPQDVVLVEFFFPMKPMSLPQQFINVGTSDYFLDKDSFFEKQILMCSGFPAKYNFYDNLDERSEFTQSTMFNLDHKVGLFIRDEHDGFVSFSDEMNITHEELNGMSGGPVYSVFHDDSEVRLAGISLSGGGSKLRFLPAYVFHDAVISYKNARCEVVDEASYLADENERPDEMLRMYCDMENKDEHFRRRLGLC
ncbi:hypothetical protein BFW38_11210 [Terasakiispira papahanaumokuakeensis]|uniref:Serine protease n=1 Tax=Terasakiispira papahanaumokuakeensis TaxID=197479 RepID=A0A1E2VAI0_9GAMM|nr:hypothetical protein [Terasakiispira papahanaumokuakeensis]ODC04020.1 hypothetical protein BFW38_11210 [Terasakiispira papahanaumokuakeensis]